MLDEQNTMNDVGFFYFGFRVKLELSEGSIEKTIYAFSCHCEFDLSNEESHPILLEFEIFRF